MLARLIISFVLIPIGFAYAGEENKGDIYEGGVEARVDALASVQPGLGVLMHEFGYRFTDMYWAANGGNWALAQYELKELREAQEVAEITRPKHAELLKAFENKQLVAVGEAIETQDIGQFNQRFSAAVEGCNACHTATGHGFVKYAVPEKPTGSFLDFNIKSAAEYEEGKER